MRKFLALVLALVMTMSLVTVSAGAATDFTDDAKIVNTEAVEVLNAMGILGGYADGSFRPQATLTRGAGAKMIAYLMLGEEKADNLKATYTVFEDVTDTVGLAPYIEWAAAQGIIGGYGDGNFGPYNLLTEYAFGKMLLGALGYDTEVEGYTGAGWQKNVYRDATYAGIYDGTESYGACTRDTAARMVLGALKANVVAYGQSQVTGSNSIYWNGQLIGANTSVVDGRIETALPLWNFYEDLTYVALGADTFGRPGHYWAYGLTFEKFYMDTPVAQFTTEIDDCDILVACGIAKTAKTSINVEKIVNGVPAGAYTATSHANCAGDVGAQGTLTQIFKVGTGNYVVTSIDTYLAHVDSVTTTAHKTQGITTLTSYEEADAAIDGDSVTYTINNGIGYAAKDYVLINVAEVNAVVPQYLTGLATPAAVMDLDDYAAYETTTADEYLYTVAAPSIISAAKFTGVAADASIATVNGIQTNVAKNYELSASQLLWANAGNKYDFFVDQYGNIIADANLIPTFTYGVITDLQFEQAALGSSSWADVALVNESSASNIVKMYKYNTVGVTEVADPATNDGTVSRYNVYNDEYYYYEDGATNALGVVRVYDLGNGGYNMVPVDAAKGVYDYTANVAKNNPNVGTEIADDDTIFVVKTLNAAGTAVYNTYAGIDAVPTMNGVSFVAVYETDIAAEFVFVDATRALFVDTAYTAVVTNPVAVYSELGQTYTYNVWVDGAAKAVTVTATNPAAANLFAGKAGVYTLSVNADGVVTVQVQLAEFATAGNSATAPWYVDTIVGLSNANTLDLTTNGAYTVNSAKIYTLYFNDVTDDNAWGAGDTLHSVAGANVNALKVAGANVIYKVNATNATVIDAIYVMAEYVD